MSSEVQEEELALVFQESTRLLPLGPTVKIDEDGFITILSAAYFSEIKPMVAKKTGYKRRLLIEEENKQNNTCTAVPAYPKGRYYMASCGTPSRITSNEITPGRTQSWYIRTMKSKHDSQNSVLSPDDHDYTWYALASCCCSSAVFVPVRSAEEKRRAFNNLLLHSGTYQV